MIKCCILEDDENDLNKIISRINSNDYLLSQLDIKHYSSPSQIQIKENEFDVLLLDIELKNENGIVFANEYIKEYPNAKIIFISTHDELVFDTFKVHPYCFIKKENINVELIDYLMELIEMININKKQLFVKTNDKTIVLNQKDIISIESYNHYCYICVRGKKDLIKFRMNMKDIMKELTEYFYQVNRSYIINLNEVKLVENGKILLRNGNEIIIKRGQIKKFQDDYDQFNIRKRMNL